VGDVTWCSRGAGFDAGVEKSKRSPRAELEDAWPAIVGATGVLNVPSPPELLIPRECCGAAGC
jgi:hypothetical protein